MAGMASGRAGEVTGTGLAEFRRWEDGAWRPRAGENSERRGRVGDLMVTRLVGLGCASRGAPNPACRRKKNGDDGGGAAADELSSDAKLKL